MRHAILGFEYEKQLPGMLKKGHDDMSLCTSFCANRPLRTMKSSKTSEITTLIFAGILCILGADLLSFLTDDAYIAFRYISQRQLGHGYTWNAPPWAPVEGYTSFAWLVLLDLTWSLTGLSPPETANSLSLLCSLASLWVFANWVAHTCSNLKHNSATLFALSLLGLVTHRVFLTWTSSGLETALFNLLVLIWTREVFMLHQRERSSPWRIASAAAGMALTRPDGYLFVMATLGAMAVHVFQNRAALKSSLAALSPFLLVATHILWRRSFYGEWLPNTYYAKVVEPMPELGMAYLLSFILEHALWLWIALFIAAIAKNKTWTYFKQAPAAGIGVLTLLIHLVFYTIIAGGDHFEYRVLSHLIPILILLLLWSVMILAERGRTAALLLFFSLVLSGLIPWIHWSVSQEQERWAPTMPSYPITQELPDIAKPYGQYFDNNQQWLFAHGVGMRHQQHKLFCEHQLRWVPGPQLANQMLGSEANATVLTTGAGVTAWSFSKAHIIDYYGLSDYVVARNRPYKENMKIIAHARRPPPGYVEAIRPNLTVTPTQITDFKPREKPLLDDNIREIEQSFRDALPVDRNEAQHYSRESWSEACELACTDRPCDPCRIGK